LQLQRRFSVADCAQVGATISCGKTHRHNDPAQPHRSNPHVQSYVLATDQVRWLFSPAANPVHLKAELPLHAGYFDLASDLLTVSQWS